MYGTRCSGKQVVYNLVTYSSAAIVLQHMMLYEHQQDYTTLTQAADVPIRESLSIVRIQDTIQPYPMKTDCISRPILSIIALRLAALIFGELT